MFLVLFNYYLEQRAGIVQLLCNGITAHYIYAIGAYFYKGTNYF
jgi:hypothetical protein